MRPPITSGYVRASKESAKPNKGDDKLSVHAQRSEIVRYVEARRHGKPDYMPPLSPDNSPIGNYQDHAVSGRKVPFGERPDGRRLLRELQRGDHLVVVRMDRLGRRTLDILQVIETMEKRGITLHIIDFFGFELAGTQSPISRLMINLLASFAQFEGDMISTRCREAIGELRRQGRRTNHIAPRGYKFTKSGMVVEDPEMQQLYREMLILHKEGHSYVWIADYLNRIGSVTHHRAKDGWTDKSVGRAVRAEIAKERAANTERLRSTLISREDAADDRPPEWVEDMREAAAEEGGSIYDGPTVMSDWPLELPPFNPEYA
jgi:DNA invertase Pin-like site-specific DNA recombinase